MTSTNEKLLVQIASYNTNLQGNAGLPQDLVDWLAPTLKVSSFLSHDKKVPDIVAVGFQELLPLHFGLSGFSRHVIESRDAFIRSQIETHAPNKDRYTLVARIVNVGIALLVYARDEEIGQRVRDVQTQWTGCGPGWMGNKGAVGVRFRLVESDADEGSGETFTFVNAHLTAHSGNVARRTADYHHIVGTLLFPSSPSSSSRLGQPTTLYDTSHLFFLGDLNFRLALPPTSAYAEPSNRPALFEALKNGADREELKEYDELLRERRRGSVFVGLREAEFWKFKCTYKYRMKEVDRYNPSRLPAWTDRVMYSSYSDSPNSPETSVIESLLYTSIPSYTTSDHKPIVALLLVPTKVSSVSSAPTLQLPASFSPTPDPHWLAKRYAGRALDRLVGFIWTFFWLIGLGSAAVGVFNFFLGVAAWRWMSAGSGNASSTIRGADVEG